MRILVTGGTGFIGAALCRELIARGHQVNVLTRDPARAEARLPPGIGLVRALHELSASPDAVINLAGENLGAHRWTEARKREFVDSRVGTTRRLVDWMRAQGVRPSVLVSGSAVGYYGARGEEPLTESSAPAREFQSEMCHEWEAEARQAESLGVRVCRIRIGIVLGPGGGALASMRLPFQLGLGAWLGDGQQWMSWIHRADLIALILRLLDDEGQSGAFNATAPNPARNKEFSKALGRALNRPVLVSMPAPVVRVLVGGMAHLLLTGQKVLPARAKALGFHFRFPDLDAALEDALGRGS